MDRFNYPLAVDVIWGLIRGLVTLTMMGRIAQGEQRARRIMEQTMLEFLLAWRTGS